MGSTKVVVCLLFLVGIAGCISVTNGQFEDVEGETVNDPEDEIPLKFAECREQLAAVPVPSEEVEASVPEGFTMTGFDPLGASAAVAFVGWTCQSTQGPSVEDGVVSEMVKALAVEPPEELRSPSAELHVLALAGFTTRADLVPLYESWGLPYEEGTVVVEDLARPGDEARAGHVLGEGSFTMHTYSSISGPVVETEPGMVRIFAAEEGALTGIVDVGSTSSYMQEGTATVQATGAGMAPISASQGFGVHYWGEGFSFTLEPVNIEAT